MPGRLRNWRHEKFAQEIVAGTDAKRAYVNAGFRPHGANFHRLFRAPAIAARIAQLRHDREIEARAAQVPIKRVLEELVRCGIERFADVYERDAAGILRPRYCQFVAAEISIALLRSLSIAFGVRMS
jgi:hypothetical protein